MFERHVSHAAPLIAEDAKQAELPLSKGPELEALARDGGQWMAAGGKKEDDGGEDEEEHGCAGIEEEDQRDCSIGEVVAADVTEGACAAGGGQGDGSEDYAEPGHGSL